MLAEEFERIARAAPETVWLEFVNGRIEVKPARDGNHSEVVMWLVKRCLEQRPELRLYCGRGLKTERHRTGRALPDGALAPHRPRATASGPTRMASS